MPKTYYKMELTGSGLTANTPAGIALVQYCPASHRDRIPQVYADAFGEKPWPADWDMFPEFDPAGMFVAVDSATAEPAGFVISFKRRDFGYISVVAVAPHIRRRGVATALLRRATDYLRARQLAKVQIDVEATNAPAVQAYTRFGFETIATSTDQE